MIWQKSNQYLYMIIKSDINRDSISNENCLVVKEEFKGTIAMWIIKWKIVANSNWYCIVGYLNDHRSRILIERNCNWYSIGMRWKQYLEFSRIRGIQWLSKCVWKLEIMVSRFRFKQQKIYRHWSKQLQHIYNECIRILAIYPN